MDSLRKGRNYLDDGSPDSGDGRGRDPEIDLRDGNFHSSDESNDSMSDDDMFTVLSSPRRRQVIEYLREHNPSASVGELAEYIAAAENEKSIDQVTSYERKRVYISLYQNHLPVMDSANLVEYDDDRKTVDLMETVTQLEPYFEDDSGSNPAHLLLGFVLGLGFIVLLGSFQFGPFAAVSTGVWAILGVVGLLGVASFNLYYRNVK